MRMADRKRWTRDELLVAFNLYHKLTFGQLHARNHAIMDVAKRMERGPSSLAMKLTFDDNLRLLLSKRLKDELPQRAVAENFAAYAGLSLQFPDDAAPPEPAYLAEHRKLLFR